MTSRLFKGQINAWWQEMQARMPPPVGDLSPAGKNITPMLRCGDVMLRHG